MGALQSHSLGFKITPEPSQETKVGIIISPQALFVNGLNIPITISTASADLQKPGFDKSSASTIAITAHLDTGASRTSIDLGLAQRLKLLSTGSSIVYTANGPAELPAYAIDLHFPNTNLQPFINLPIGSCNLSGQSNFSMLLGRDIMSRWNIVWNGPSSTVIIND